MFKLSQIILVFLLISFLQSAPVIPHNYVLYTQCNSSWANDTMGLDGWNICEDGCAMSDVAMAIASHNILIDGEISTPATLNKWLQLNQGYGGNTSNLNVPQVVNISSNIQYIGSYESGTDLTRKQIIKNLETKTMVHVASVRNHTHWVLVTGYDDENKDIYYVNDPYFNVTSYEIDGIRGWFVYNIQDATQQYKLGQIFETLKSKFLQNLN